MRPTSSNRWTTALVIGLGQSGLAATRLLQHLGVRVRGYDRRDETPVPDGIEPFLGGDTPPASAYADLDLLVLSPGIAPEPFLAQQREHAQQAEIHGELSLGLQLAFSDDPRWGASRLVLVTGTNGKSTVTALIGHLLSSSGRRAFAGGNLGVPLCTLMLEVARAETVWPDDLVLECSSFQLETLRPVPTDVGIVLNVTPDHLDRYATLEAYARTKARVFSGLSEDGLALLEDGDEWTDAIAPTDGPRVVRVGATADAHIEGEGSGTSLRVGEDPPYPRELLRLPGRHNAKNALFALSAARHLGLTADQCRNGLATFEGLPHRMTLVRELDGVRYYDDSKATNVASALASLGGLDDPFVLIAGGRAKGDDLGPLGELLTRRARGLVAIGEAAQRFAALAHGRIPTEIAETMTDAVRLARSMARSGDAVVLAPACASFDWYRSYAHRGDDFASVVRAL